MRELRNWEYEAIKIAKTIWKIDDRENFIYLERSRRLRVLEDVASDELSLMVFDQLAPNEVFPHQTYTFKDDRTAKLLLESDFFEPQYETFYFLGVDYQKIDLDHPVGYKLKPNWKIIDAKQTKFNQMFEEIKENAVSSNVQSYHIKTPTGTIVLEYSNESKLFYTKSRDSRPSPYKIEFDFSLKGKLSKQGELLSRIWGSPNIEIPVSEGESALFQGIKQVLINGNSKSNPSNVGIPDKKIVDEIFQRTRKWVKLNISGFILPR